MRRKGRRASSVETGAGRCPVEGGAGRENRARRPSVPSQHFGPGPLKWAGLSTPRNAAAADSLLEPPTPPTAPTLPPPPPPPPSPHRRRRRPWARPTRHSSPALTVPTAHPGPPAPATGRLVDPPRLLAPPPPLNPPSRHSLPKTETRGVEPAGGRQRGTRGARSRPKVPEGRARHSEDPTASMADPDRRRRVVVVEAGAAASSGRQGRAAPGGSGRRRSCSSCCFSCFRRRRPRAARLSAAATAGSP